MPKLFESVNGILHQPETFRCTAQRKLSRDCHLSAPGLGGHIAGVLPVVHPTDHNWRLNARQIIKCQSAVAILTVIGPESECGRVVIGEARAVELADEVLFARASLQCSWIQPNLEHPARLAGLAFYGQFEKLGTFPLAARCSVRAEVAKRLPMLQIGRSVKTNPVIVRERDGHHPA